MPSHKEIPDPKKYEKKLIDFLESTKNMINHENIGINLIGAGILGLKEHIEKIIRNKNVLYEFNAWANEAGIKTSEISISLHKLEEDLKFLVEKIKDTNCERL